MFDIERYDGIFPSIPLDTGNSSFGHVEKLERGAERLDTAVDDNSARNLIGNESSLRSFCLSVGEA